MTRYKGRPCPKHPELDGLRNRNSHKCPGCLRDWRKGTERGRQARREAARRYYERHRETINQSRSGSAVLRRWLRLVLPYARLPKKFSSPEALALTRGDLVMALIANIREMLDHADHALTGRPIPVRVPPRPKTGAAHKPAPQAELPEERAERLMREVKEEAAKAEST